LHFDKHWEVEGYLQKKQTMPGDKLAEELDLSQTGLKKIDPALTTFRRLKSIKSIGLSTRIKRELKDLLYLIGEFNRLEIGEQEGVNLYGLLQKESVEIDTDTLLAATNINHNVLRNKVESLLSNRFKTVHEKSFNTSHQLVFYGYFPQQHFYKKQLEKHGFQYAAMAGKNATHALIGEAISPYDRKEIREKKLICLTLKDLQTILEKLEMPYLKAKAAQYTDGLDNLANMLDAEEEKNVELALGILQGGGVPEALLTDVLLVQLFHPNSLYQSKARRLLDIHAPQKLTDFLSNHPFQNKFTEVQLADWLARSHKKGKPNTDKIARFLYQKKKRGGYYIFTKGTLKLRHELLKAAHDKGELDLSNYSLKEVPIEIFDYKKWRTLNLSYNRLMDFPYGNEIDKMGQLKVLDLRFNKIVNHSFPVSIEGLTVLL